MATSFVTHVQTGVHGSRPGAGSVPQGTLFACTTHALIYQSDGSSTWSTWYGTSGVSSFGSNVNAVGEANSAGASASNTRADHVHLGVRSVAHASNTFSGPVILTASSPIGITSPTPGTYNISSAAVAGGGALTVADEGSPLSTAATTLDFVGAGVTASGSGATKTITIAGGSTLTQIASIEWGATGVAAAFCTPIVECLGSGTLTCKLRLNQTGSAVFVNLIKNGARVQQLTSSSGTNTYTFSGETVAAGDQFYITISNGGVAVPTRIADAFDLSAGLRLVGMPVSGMLVV